MTIKFLHLRSSHLHSPLVLLKKSDRAQRETAVRLIERGITSVPVNNGGHFDFQMTEHPIADYRSFVIEAQQHGTTCGFVQIQVLPVKRSLPLKMAEIHTRSRDLPAFREATDEIATTEVAMKVDSAYRTAHHGIGTSLLALSLHLSLSLGLPLLQVREDISIHGSRTRDSFYEKQGFATGLEVNKALRRLGIGEIVPHTRSNKIFYLNGILDGTIEFVIPPIGIEPR